MPGPSDRERLLKLIDSAAPAPSAPVAAPRPAVAVSAPDPTAPLARPPQVVFEWKERAARVYDRVRAAVTAPEADHRFPMATAVSIILVAAVLFLGIDRWRTWSATREVATVSEAESRAVGESLGLKLVGVDWSEVPVALVENTSTGKTHFLRQGDGINGARVQLIFKDKVIFNTSKGRIALR